MNAKQRNKLSMFRATDQVFVTYASELNSIPALRACIEDFEHTLVRINEVHQVQRGHATGARQLKLKEEAEMIQATLQMAGALYVYAQVNQLPDLQAKCAISGSQLERLSDVEVKVACLTIYDEAVKLGDALSDYGKTPEAIAQLKKEIDDFSALISSPRSAIVTRSQATRELGTLITEANDVLRHKVDKLMEQFKISHPNIYNTYKAARIIVDLRAGKRVVEEE